MAMPTSSRTSRRPPALALADRDLDALGREAGRVHAQGVRADRHALDREAAVVARLGRERLLQHPRHRSAVEVADRDLAATGRSLASRRRRRRARRDAGRGRRARSVGGRP
jgi:hypothetical protein